jgi:hypothetical protein
MGGAVLAGGLAGSEAVAAADAASASNVPPNVPEWMKAPGDPVGSQLYGTPSPFEKGVVRNVPRNAAQYLSAASRTPLQDLDGIITPNGLFYERHHGGVPAIDPAQHRLMLHGLVDKPLIFTMDDISRFPTESRIHFLECSGNPGYKKPYGKTASDLVGLLSCAEWTGVSLKLVLQEAGLQQAAKWVVAAARRSGCRPASLGAKGEGGLADRLVGGQGTIATPKPVRTVGSFWPYAPTLFDYIRRAMPQNAPQSLDNNEVYAVSAYILNLNGLLPADATLDAKTLSAIEMPNRNMFVSDPRPDVKNPACMTGC